MLIRGDNGSVFGGFASVNSYFDYGESRCEAVKPESFIFGLMSGSGGHPVKLLNSRHNGDICSGGIGWHPLANYVIYKLNFK